MDSAFVSQSYGELIEQELEPAHPIVEGLLDEDGGAIIAGSPGVGKTWVELSLASAIASGESWVCHFPTKQGPVLIIDEESNVRGMQGRLQMMENAHPIGLDAPIHFAIGHGIRLDTPEGMMAIDALLNQHKPVAVFLDSFTRFHGGNENSSGEMAGVFRNAKALMQAHKTIFIFLDHIRKKSFINDIDEMIRGSSEKKAWPDSIIYLTGMEKGLIRVDHIKMRWAETVPNFRIRTDIDSYRKTAELVYDGLAPSMDTTKANDLILAIHSINEQLGSGHTDATTLSAWLSCSPDTVTRHAKKLVAASILKQVTVRGTGGRSKITYDVQGGMD